VLIFVLIAVWYHSRDWHLFADVAIAMEKTDSQGEKLSNNNNNNNFYLNREYTWWRAIIQRVWKINNINSNTSLEVLAKLCWVARKMIILVI